MRGQALISLGYARYMIIRTIRMNPMIITGITCLLSAKGYALAS